MNKEQKVISLPLAKELQKVAKENGFELPDSEYSWIVDNETEKATLSKSWNPFDLMKCEKYSYYKAYDTSELGAILRKIELEYFDQVPEWDGFHKKWYFNSGYEDTERIDCKKDEEANARCKMLIYLISNKLI